MSSSTLRRKRSGLRPRSPTRIAQSACETTRASSSGARTSASASWARRAVSRMSSDPSGSSTARSRRPRSWALPIGAAVGGLRPVVDIMFSSFAYVAFDQLVNQAGRLRYMTGGQVRRAARRRRLGRRGGRERRPALGGSASASSSKPAGCGSSSRRPRTRRSGSCARPSESDDPVVVLHHPALGSTRGTVDPEPLGLGEARVDPVGTDVSSDRDRHHGASRAGRRPQRSKGKGMSVEVVDVCSLSPMPWETILASVEKTGRAVVVDEGRLTCSVASEIAAGLGRAGFRQRCGRRSAASPSRTFRSRLRPSLEQAVIPGEERHRRRGTRDRSWLTTTRSCSRRQG